MSANKTYVAVYSRDPVDDAWNVRIKGVAGCQTHGRSIRQAHARIREALAAWLDASLVETTSEATLEALHDADARHGLVLPRPASDTPVVSKARARARKKVANSVDVAVVAIELLNAL